LVLLPLDLFALLRQSLGLSGRLVQLLGHDS
jgi:hypothetical protein